MTVGARTRTWLAGVALLSVVLLAATPAAAGKPGAVRARAVAARVWKKVVRPIRRVREAELGALEGRLGAVRARALKHQRATIFGPLHRSLDEAHGQIQKARSGNPLAARKNVAAARQTIERQEAHMTRHESVTPVATAPR
jgi:hypothetical protein